MAVLKAGNYDDLWDDVETNVVTDDSLARVENKQKVAQDSVLLSLTEGMKDSVEKAEKVEQHLISQQENRNYWEINKDDLHTKVENALRDYDTFKTTSSIDDLELEYEKFKNQYTTSQGTYILENYQTYAESDQAWTTLYQDILPTGADNFNPFWTADPKALEKFRAYDLEKRNQYLELNKTADAYYDAIFDGAGNPNEEYDNMLSLRDDALGSVTNYNLHAPDDEKLNINQMLSGIKAQNLEASMVMDELNTSKDINKLIRELADTETRARQSRTKINMLALGTGSDMIPMYDGDGMRIGTGLELQQMISANESFAAASDLDPNLFDTYQGLFVKGWEDVADKGWFGSEVSNEEEFLEYLMSNQISPQLFGYQPDDPEFQQLLIDMYKDANLEEMGEEPSLDSSAINVNKFY